MEEQFCLRWNDYQSNLSNVFGDLLLSQAFVDVTLACDGASLKAHKVILSACSPFFQDILMNNPCKHPVIILKDISFCELKTIVDFMYKGQVDVSQSDLSSLLRTAEMLKIKGLADMDQGENTRQEAHLNSDFQSNIGRISPENFNYKRTSSQQNKKQKRQHNSQISHNERNLVEEFRTNDVVIRPIPPQDYIETVDPAIPEDIQTPITSIKQQLSSPELDNEEFEMDFVKQEINGDNSNLQPKRNRQNMNHQKSNRPHQTEPDILPGTSSHSQEDSHDMSMLENEASDTSHLSNDAANQPQQLIIDSRIPDAEQNSSRCKKQCPLCQKLVCNLNRHFLVHEMYRPRFRCNLCKASYKYRCDLTSHLKACHPKCDMGNL